MRAAHCISRRRRIRSMSFSSKQCTRLRPDSLAAPQAESAADRARLTGYVASIMEKSAFEPGQLWAEVKRAMPGRVAARIGLSGPHQAARALPRSGTGRATMLSYVDLRALRAALRRQRAGAHRPDWQRPAAARDAERVEVAGRQRVGRHVRTRLHPLRIIK